ncbi:hypothetical protein H0H93_012638 [Arthromyces matolae]|nr:hypothetical protein H0H93_012638 [Arthromyces matolae]
MAIMSAEDIDGESRRSPLEKYDVKVTSTSAESIPSYEHAAVTTGAPVEKISPLGHHVDSITVIFLNISRMIGTEYASYFPHRSGAEVAYLEKAWHSSIMCRMVLHANEHPIYVEQAYPKPKFLLPTTFAVQAVLLSFSSSNAIVLAQYLLVAGGAQATTWNVRGLAVGAMTVIVIICISSTKWSLRLSNAIGVLKLIMLIFISITGLVVLGGHTRVEDPHANFRNSFAGTTHNGNGLATALVKVNFAYSGFENAFNVLNEVPNPIRTMKRFAPLALTIVFTLYFFVNIAYFAAIPKAEIRTSKQLTASLFFLAVFGNTKSVKALSALVAVSAFGNILSVIIGTSRIIRECGRQVVDLQSYPANVFSFLMTFGLIVVRRRRAKIGAPKSEFRAWNAVLAFAICVNIYVLVLPWVPPVSGIYGGDVSFFYATYCIVGIGLLVISGLAYVLYIHILPKLGGYKIRQLVEKLDDGAMTNRLVKVLNSELAEWDATHDEHGEVIERRIEVSEHDVGPHTGLSDKTG